MSYPEKGATYKNTPKFIDRMKEEENRDDGGQVNTQAPPPRTVTTDSGASIGSGMRPNPNASYDPKTGKVKGF